MLGSYVYPITITIDYYCRKVVCACLSHNIIIDPPTFIILLDIEGTTTPVDFVYQTLFPYALNKLPTFLQEHFQEPETKSLIQHLYLQRETDERHGLKPPPWIDGSDQLRAAFLCCLRPMVNE